MKFVKDSSTVRAATYNPEDSSIDVTFASGGRYRYFDYPFHMVNDFENADSPGAYLQKHIKPGRRYERLS